MDQSTIINERLHNQRITGTPLHKPADVVRWLVAVQAQDYASAKWAIGQRMVSAFDHEVEQAFNSGDVLRTHLLRPTWHFVAPDDIRWLLALTAPQVHALNAHYYRLSGLDQDTFNRSNKVLANSLEGGKQLTRDELRVELEQAGIPTGNTLRMSLIMMQAELNALVCSGARRGKQFTYALLDDRVSQPKNVERSEALVELARRYIFSRGPAAVQDFAKWSGLSIADARAGLEAVKTQLDHAIVNEQEYWFPPSQVALSDRALHGALLPIYDEYISSYKDWSIIVDASEAQKLVALGNALTAIILVNGQIAGTWKRILKRESVVIKSELFVKLPKEDYQAVSAAVERYGTFLGLKIIWQESS